MGDSCCRSCSSRQISKYFLKNSIVEEAKVEVSPSLGNESTSLGEGPKVGGPEINGSLAPPNVSKYFKKRLKVEDSKIKSNSRRKNPVRVKPLSKDEMYLDAYERKTSDNNWKPPCTPWHLIQEDHAHDPWRVLVICLLLNRTTGSQVFLNIFFTASLISWLFYAEYDMLFYLSYFNEYCLDEYVSHSDTFSCYTLAVW